MCRHFKNFIMFICIINFFIYDVISLTANQTNNRKTTIFFDFKFDLVFKIKPLTQIKEKRNERLESLDIIPPKKEKNKELVLYIETLHTCSI